MIRKHKSPYRVPWKHLEATFNGDTGGGIHDIPDNSFWVQRSSDYNTLTRKWAGYIINKDIIDRNVNIVIHTLAGSIDPHTDNLAKTVYLIPLRLPKKMPVYLFEDNRDVRLQKNYFYTFNDYNEHGICVGNGDDYAKVYLMTIDLL